ncbi:MAG: hypothetical protein GXO43_09455 [Crenarchaeota archaeon]|nr:hypothetical protein [Thermoproteota archaeon]
MVLRIICCLFLRDLVVGMVFAYLHNGSRPFGLGSSFREFVVEKGLSVDRWVGMVLILVNRTVEAYSVGGRGLITGVFLDEADPGYLGRCDKCFVGEYVDAVIRIISAVHRLDLKVLVNGVRGFAQYG